MDKKDIEFALTIAAIPVTILILVLAGLFTRRESFTGMIAIIVSTLDLRDPVDFINENLIAGTLLCGSLLFPLQARSNVPGHSSRSSLSACAEVAHNIRCHYHRSNSYHHRQRNHVCLQLQTWPQTLHCQQESRKRGGKTEYDGDAQPCPRACAESDDHRLSALYDTEISERRFWAEYGGDVIFWIGFQRAFDTHQKVQKQRRQKSSWVE